MDDTDDFILCADESRLNEAIIAVQSCTTVILDCEGQSLDRKAVPSRL